MTLKQNVLLLFDNKLFKDRFHGFLYTVTMDPLNVPELWFMKKNKENGPCEEKKIQVEKGNKDQQRDL